MQLKNLAVLVALPFALVACGGGGGSSSSGGGLTAGSTIESQFIDAPVKGLKVEKTSGNGETGANGIFSCKAGEQVKFWLKEISGTGLLLGTANCGSKIYIDEFGATADKAGALIQSLSTGVHATRTELDLSAFNTTNVDFASVNLSTVSITTVFGQADDTIDLEKEVTELEAREHIDSYLPQIDDAAISSLANQPASWLTLKKVSGSASCIDNISAKIKVAETVKADKKIYHWTVEKSVYHNNGANLTTAQQFEDVCLLTESNYDEVFWCEPEPSAPRLMTGKSFDFSSYEFGEDNILAAQAKLCWSELDQEFYSPVLGDCGSDTNYVLDKDYTLPWSWGYTFNVAFTNNNYSVSYFEYESEAEPFKISDGVAGLKMNSYTCEYSGAGSVEIK